MAANLSKQPPITDEGHTSLFRFSGMGGSSTESLHPNQDLLRAHQGTPVMNQGPKAGDSSKKGVTNGIFVPLVFQQLLERVWLIQVLGSLLNWLAHFWQHQNMGQKNTGRCFTPEELSKGTLWVSFQVIFCLRTYGHIISNNW